MSAETELQRQNERLQLLLDLTTKITSNLDLREVLHAIFAHARERALGEVAAVALPDEASGKLRIYALDLPDGPANIREGMLISFTGPTRAAFETLKPTIANTSNPDDFSPEEQAQNALLTEPKTVCNLPLVSRGRALGFLRVGRTAKRPYGPDEIDFLRLAASQIAIAIENALAYEEISRLKDKLSEEKHYLEEAFRSEMGFERIIGSSPAIKHVLQMVDTVAPSDSTVLLLGETGTGKELIARAIHERSRRKDRTFVKLNCAAIPTGLLESELFGHEKGAFTGAINQKVGRMELADQGTLFLDEVGDIPPRNPTEITARPTGA